MYLSISSFKFPTIAIHGALYQVLILDRKTFVFINEAINSGSHEGTSLLAEYAILSKIIVNPFKVDLKDQDSKDSIHSS